MTNKIVQGPWSKTGMNTAIQTENGVLKQQIVKMDTEIKLLRIHLEAAHQNIAQLEGIIAMHQSEESAKSFDKMPTEHAGDMGQYELETPLAHDIVPAQHRPRRISLSRLGWIVVFIVVGVLAVLSATGRR